MKQEEYLQQTQDFYTPKLFTPSKTEQAIKILLKPEVFYQTIMNNAQEEAKSLHLHITQFLNADSKTNNSDIRAKLSSSYWNFLETIIKLDNVLNEIHIKILLRYGVLVSSAISKDILDIIIYTDLYAIPKASIYYIDEWIESVVKGDISQSLLDNEKAVSPETLSLHEKQRLTQLYKLQDNLLKKATDLSLDSKNIINQIQLVTGNIQSLMIENELGYIPPIDNISVEKLYDCIQQIQAFRLKNKQLQETHTNIEKYKTELESSENNISIEQETDEKHKEIVQSKILEEEFTSIRQMFKICVGKTGNHMPILFKRFFSNNIGNFGTKETVLQIIKKIEDIDYRIFFRRIKQTTIRTFPQILLVPCYGSYGFCWEPFNFYNRNTSAAKIIIPMYSNNLFYSICYALGDYRWQISKEEAGFRWTLEGMTGQYNQWSEENKIGGSLKENFINDYIQWIQWESKGTSKLDKNVRLIFWKHIPFTENLKKQLKKQTSIFRKLL